ATGKKLAEFRGNVVADGLAFSPDGRLLAFADYHSLVLWDTRKRQSRVVSVPRPLACAAVAFSPDGRSLAAGSFNNIFDKIRPANGLRLYDAATGLETLRFGDDQTLAHAVLFAPDGRTLFSLRLGDLRLWEVATGKERRRIDLRKCGEPDAMA